MQKALNIQLTKDYERVDLQLREREAELKNVRKKREDIGVELYGIQHQLAKLQNTFDRAQDNYNIVKRYREEAEQNKQRVRKQFEEKKIELQELDAKVAKSQEELNQLNRTLRQVEDYNEQMKDHIGVIRRETYKAEEAVSDMEKYKKKQDLLIDNMNEQIKALSEQKHLYVAQLQAQQEETREARKTQKEAEAEIAEIIRHKNNLMKDWEDKIIAMQRLQTAYEGIRSILNTKREELDRTMIELSVLQSELSTEERKAEELRQTEATLEMRKENLIRKKGELDDKKRVVEEEKRMLEKSKQATEQEITGIQDQEAQIEEERKLILKEMTSLNAEIQDLSKGIQNSSINQEAIEKEGADISKQTKQNYQKVLAKEMEKQERENEIARVNIDILTTKSHIEILEAKKADYEKELSELEKRVNIMEREISTQNKNISKKLQEIAQLNKQLNKQEEDAKKEQNTTNLDVYIKKMKKDNEEKEKECAAKRNEWTRKETEYLTLIQQKDQMRGIIEKERNEIIVLEQKKMRLQTTTSILDKEIRVIEINLKNLGNEMNKLNVLLKLHRAAKDKLEQDNYNIEKAFIQKLKDMETATSKLEQRVQELKDEKADLLTQIVEAERQIMLWERKIELEKKMQEEIKPDYEKGSIQKMKEDIHSMKLKYEDLKRVSL
jgi:chromosome segregation ATPase